MESDSLLNFVSDAVARVLRHSVRLIFAVLVFEIPEFHYPHFLIQRQLFFPSSDKNHFLFSEANFRQTLNLHPLPFGLL
jgi:hypothetical protein